MIRAAGIDLGGTKSEVQLFDGNWRLVDRRRDATPRDYDALVAMLAGQVRWARERAGGALPVGIGAAGLVDAKGNAFTANLAAMGRPLPADLARAAGQGITYVNDCRALALSEAVFGAGRSHATVMSLILGTGVGGGVVHDGELRKGPAGTGGEFGHMPVSGPALLAHGLGLRDCGCGRRGCVESYVSGPGLARIGQEISGREITPEEIVALRHTDPGATRAWAAWLDLAADMALALVQTVDPDVIVLGGGLSRVEGLAQELHTALARAQIPGFGVAPIVIADGGDASGARGAALAAWQEART